MNAWHSLTQTLTGYWETLKRACAYAWFSRDNYDWDHSQLIRLIVFKLKRLEHCILTGHHVVEKAERQSIRLAIRLGERLLDEKDYFTFYDRHNAKWGDLQVLDGKDYGHSVETIFYRANIGPGQEDQERAEFLIARDKDEQMRARHSRWLFGIIDRHHRRWWD